MTAEQMTMVGHFYSQQIADLRTAQLSKRELGCSFTYLSLDKQITRRNELSPESRELL